MTIQLTTASRVWPEEDGADLELVLLGTLELGHLRVREARARRLPDVDGDGKELQRHDVALVRGAWEQRRPKVLTCVSPR